MASLNSNALYPPPTPHYHDSAKPALFLFLQLASYVSSQALCACCYLCLRCSPLTTVHLADSSLLTSWLKSTSWYFPNFAQPDIGLAHYHFRAVRDAVFISLIIIWNRCMYGWMDLLVFSLPPRLGYKLLVGRDLACFVIRSILDA